MKENTGKVISRNGDISYFAEEGEGPSPRGLADVLDNGQVEWWILASLEEDVDYPGGCPRYDHHREDGAATIAQDGAMAWITNDKTTRYVNEFGDEEVQ